MNEIQAREAVIMNAEQTAERMLERARSSYAEELSVPREELRQLALQTLAVVGIATVYHRQVNQPAEERTQ